VAAQRRQRSNSGAAAASTAAAPRRWQQRQRRQRQLSGGGSGVGGSVGGSGGGSGSGSGSAAGDGGSDGGSGGGSGSRQQRCHCLRCRCCAAAVAAFEHVLHVNLRQRSGGSAATAEGKWLFCSAGSLFCYLSCQLWSLSANLYGGRTIWQMNRLFLCHSFLSMNGLTLGHIKISFFSFMNGFTFYSID
jgi:hypothetical protein